MSIRIKQHDISDCGAACLASVAAHYRLLLPLAQIRQYAGITARGASLFGLSEAATRLGFDACGVKSDNAGLSKIPLPAIAHLQLNDGTFHFIVVYRVFASYLRVMDPSTGKLHYRKKSAFLNEWSGALLLLLPGQPFKPAKEKHSAFRRLCQLLLPHRKMTLQILFGAGMHTLLSLSGIIFIQKITDYVLPDANTGLLNLMSMAMLLILCLQLFIGATKHFYMLITGQKIDAALISGYYHQLMRLPQSFFDTMQHGEIISRVNDAIKIRAFVNDIATGLIVNSLILLFSFAFMLAYHWKMALFLVVAIPFYILLYGLNNRLNRKNQRQLMEQAAAFESRLIESISAINTIKRFALEAFMLSKLDSSLLDLLQIVYKSGKATIFSRTASEMIAQLLVITFLWTGAGYVLAHEITAGELFSFYALAGYFTGPVTSIITSNKTIQDALIATDRLYEIMDLKKEVHDDGFNLSGSLKKAIRFENVCFRYGTEPLLLDQFCLKIMPGRLTAITGTSGSGKSTLFSLLQNLYPVLQGNIYIEDQNINHIALSSLRKSISIVPQHIDIFSGSILENIAPGEYAPDMERIYDVCKQAGILTFVKSLPQGLATPAGENGARLSGGQRQRIGFARALYPDPQILLLDEVTSALDLLSESHIQETIRQLLRQQKTIVLIAHRLHTLKQAHRIVVMENGMVVEEGTHQELILIKNYYYRLWQESGMV